MLGADRAGAFNFQMPAAGFERCDLLVMSQAGTTTSLRRSINASAFCGTPCGHRSGGAENLIDVMASREKHGTNQCPPLVAV